MLNSQNPLQIPSVYQGFGRMNGFTFRTRPSRLQNRHKRIYGSVAGHFPANLYHSVVMHPLSHQSQVRRGFSLLEMLVSVTILMLIMLVVFQVIHSTSRVWKDTSTRLESTRSARAGFEMMTSQLRQATVNTYWDYFDANCQSRSQTNKTDFKPVAYGRQSELHFISGPSLLSTPTQITHAVFFQCPLGTTDTPAYAPLNSLLNECGFFVTFGSDRQVINGPPDFLNLRERYRYRLMQFQGATENLKVYGNNSGNTWFTTPLQDPRTSARIVAENVIALVILPMTQENAPTPISPDFKYDSRNSAAFRSVAASGWTNPLLPQPYAHNQMPPLLRVILVTIDEEAAARLQGNSSTQPALIQNALAPLFQQANKLEEDLSTLRGVLSNAHVNCRVYDAPVAVRSARFSDQ